MGMRGAGIRMLQQLMKGRVPCTLQTLRSEPGFGGEMCSCFGVLGCSLLSSCALVPEATSWYIPHGAV